MGFSDTEYKSQSITTIGYIIYIYIYIQYAHKNSTSVDGPIGLDADFHNTNTWN